MVDIWKRKYKNDFIECSFCKRQTNLPYRFSKNIPLCEECYNNNHKKSVTSNMLSREDKI